MSPPIWSPCKKICLVDPAEPICVGCFRTMEELGRWTLMTDDERKAVKAELKAREAAYRASRGAGGT
ncbi:MAG: DUF1289 domain-containing protein [Pseudomonadota bacterium]